jgi:hypothetical protein
MSIDAERVTGDVENLRPEHSLELKVLICSREKRLSTTLVTVNFIEDSIVDKLS